jgi:subtilase family serine protease
VVRVESPPWRIEVPLRGLSAGESERIEARFTIANEERGRDHTFRVLVDPEGRVHEAGKANNLAQAPPLRIPHLPDLIVRSAHGEMLPDARSVKVVAEIGNVGGAAARGLGVRAASGDWEAAETIGELGAGSNTRIEITLVIRPKDRGKQHTFSVNADPQSRIPELNEDNNSRQTAPLQVPDLPDLRVKGLSAEILKDAVTLQFTVTVVNDGGASAVGAKVVARSGDWVAPPVSAPPLAVGAEATVTINLEIPEEERGRAHRFEVAVDPDGEITELDEENNRAFLEELYLLPLPDLLIRDLQAGVAEDGRTVVITAALINRGGASS